MQARRETSKPWHVAVSLTLVGLLGACSGGGAPTTDQQSTAASSATSSSTTASSTAAAPTGGCALSALLVPSCGVLLGVSTRPPTQERLAFTESQAGRRFDLVYRYHDLTTPIPDDTERAQVAQGRVLHVSIAARVYAQPATTVTYAQIVAGKYDAGLTKQAQGVAGLGVPVFLTFEQEANQRKKVDIRGTPADFVAAWRHVRDVYRRGGAANAVWVWVMTGAEDKLDRAGTLWPGNDAVDWISWNVYNGSGCNSGTVKPGQYKTFDQAVRPFYEWVHTQGPALGIDPAKPMMISESGSVLYHNDLGRTGDWYQQIPEVLPSYPQIKAITLWASATSDACDYRFQDHPEVASAVATALASPVFATGVSVPAVSPSGG